MELNPFSPLLLFKDDFIVVLRQEAEKLFVMIAGIL
jgi:hypothetical protein